MLDNLEELYLALDDLVAHGVDLKSEVVIRYFDRQTREPLIGSIGYVKFDEVQGTVELVENLD